MDESLLPSPYKPKENADERARLIFEQFRWKDGKPRCPECGSWRPIYKQTRKGVSGYYRCPTLHGQSTKPLVFTVRTATSLERSHVPFEKWLYCLAWYAYLPSQHRVPPATTLARLIHVNRKTASSILKLLDELRYGDQRSKGENSFLLELMASIVRK